MHKSILVIPALAHLAAADLDPKFTSALSQVVSQASGLADAVSSWSSGDGLAGALGIQSSYNPLSSGVVSLESAVSGLSFSTDDSDAAIQEATSFVSVMVALLNSLTEKAADFKAVSASEIVQNDVSNLAGPAGSIESSVVEAIPSGVDCSILSSASDLLNSLQDAFTSVGSAYSVSPPSAPSITVSCNSGGGNSASASATGQGSAGSNNSSSTNDTSAGSSDASSSGNSTGSKSATSARSSGSGSATGSATGSRSGSAGSSASRSATESSSASNVGATAAVGAAALIGAVAMLI